MARPALVTIHSSAIRHNLLIAKRAAPHSNVMPALKANAYGHGALHTAEVLQDLADGFLTACLSEAIELRESGITLPLMVIQGHQSAGDLNAACEKDIRLVIHDEAQLGLLDSLAASRKVKITLKLDTGMHRLGLPPEKSKTLFEQLQNHPNVNPDVWLMTHLACADDVKNSYTEQQITSFKKNTQSIVAPKTIANSAGILGWPDSHQDWIRPGIMTYGASPLINQTRKNLDLRACMTLTTPLVSMHTLKKGDAIGYGSTWSCPNDMKVGVIACGYADGYPRHAVSGTPIWINGKTTRILGRVSMDLIVIDLSDISAQIGDWVECWGKHIDVDTVAASAETISYELLCHAGSSCKNTTEPS